MSASSTPFAMPVRLVAAFMLVCALPLGCGDDGSGGTSKKDASARATVEPPDSTTAAAQVCDTIDQCEGLELFVSKKECTRQLGTRFETMLTEECFKCSAEITCAGWKALKSGEKQLCEICADACPCDDAGTAAGFVDSCQPGSKSVPNSAGDPCPQTDPKCPAAIYAAIATCGPDGTWSKDAFGSIMCACVPRAGTGTGGAPAMMPHPVCGNGKVEAPEQCEVSNLNNATCTSLGLGVGLLFCNKMTCMYDTSTCGAMQKPPPDEDGGA